MTTTEPWSIGPDIDGIPGQIGHVVFWPGHTSPRRPWWIVEWQPDNGGVFVIVNADGVIGTAMPNELTRDFRKCASNSPNILADATPAQWDTFDAAARAAGHPSGKSAANELNLWDSTVAEAIKIAGCTEEAT